MKTGIALPHMGLETSPALITRMAQEAECLNYASLWVGERLLRPHRHVPYGGNPPGPLPAYFQSIYDPLETLAYVAAKTERITLGTSVICTFFHVPVVLARRIATLDQLSQGRVLAGLGQGLASGRIRDGKHLSAATRTGTGGLSWGAPCGLGTRPSSLYWTFLSYRTIGHWPQTVPTKQSACAFGGRYPYRARTGGSAG